MVYTQNTSPDEYKFLFDTCYYKLTDFKEKYIMLTLIYITAHNSNVTLHFSNQFSDLLTEANATIKDKTVTFTTEYDYNKRFYSNLLKLFVDNDFQTKAYQKQRRKMMEKYPGHFL